MHPSQGSKASQLRPLCKRAEAMPDLWDIHEVGGALVSVLRISSADKAEEPRIQGKAKGKDQHYQVRSAASSLTIKLK
jgi:hypothetical protein